MSDSSGHRRDETAPGDKPWKKDTKNIPPLVWLIIAGLVVIIAVTFFYSRASGVRGEGPPPAPAASTQPAAPASGG